MELANAERRNMVERHLNQHREESNSATYALNLRGQRTYLPVIRLNPTALLLNHSNHRLAAQLRDHSAKTAVEREPWGDTAQNTLHTLLRETEQFAELKQQLRDFGQQEPGLITRDGLLVNGNTRVAALIDLEVNFVEVAVLPDTVSETDILDVEMNLQLTDYVHQDYTYTNELLMMKGFLDAGGSALELGKRKGWTRGIEPRVEWNMRTLDYIEEVRALSDPPVPYAEFDNKRQHLKDLDDAYMAAHARGDTAGADALKWNRLSAIFLGLNKDQVREIDSEFIDEQLRENIKERNPEALPLLDQHAPRPVNSGFTEIFGEIAQEDGFHDTKSFLRSFLNSRASEDATSEGLYAEIAFVARRRAEQKIDAAKLDKDNSAPEALLEDMKQRVATLRTKIPDVINNENFKPGGFQYQLNKLKEQVEALESDFLRLRQ